MFAFYLLFFFVFYANAKKDVSLLKTKQKETTIFFICLPFTFSIFLTSKKTFKLGVEQSSQFPVNVHVNVLLLNISSWTFSTTVMAVRRAVPFSIMFMTFSQWLIAVFARTRWTQGTHSEHQPDEYRRGFKLIMFESSF